MIGIVRPEEWNEIRKVYRDFAFKNIDENSKKRGIIAWNDPYFYKWKFSPAECIAWQYIRSFGPPLYPQVPIDKYFIDFANPVNKIGLEIDGKEWHNKGKDLIRDTKLKKLGWTIFRATGSETYKYQEEEFEDEIDAEEGLQWTKKYNYYLEHSLEGLLRCIRYIYFDDDCNRYPLNAVEILNNHCNFKAGW